MKEVVLRDVHTGNPKLIHVGEYSYGYESARLYCSSDANLYIGKFCSIAWGLQLFLGGNHRTHWVSTYPFGFSYPKVFTNYPHECVTNKDTTHGDIVIGNDVYIGANVIIMSGVKIGDGAVLSANSIVYKNVKPYSIVIGNPAEFLYYRFNEEIIKKLLEIKWWDWSIYNINRALPYICSRDPQKLINFYEKHVKSESDTKAVGERRDS